MEKTSIRLLHIINHTSRTWLGHDSRTVVSHLQLLHLIMRVGGYYLLFKIIHYWNVNGKRTSPHVHKTSELKSSSKKKQCQVSLPTTNEANFWCPLQCMFIHSHFTLICNSTTIRRIPLPRKNFTCLVESSFSFLSYMSR